MGYSAHLESKEVGVKVGDLVRSRLDPQGAIGYIIKENTFWGGDSVWVRWLGRSSVGGKDSQMYKENLILIKT